MNEAVEYVLQIFIATLGRNAFPIDTSIEVNRETVPRASHSFPGDAGNRQESEFTTCPTVPTMF